MELSKETRILNEVKKLEKIFAKLDKDAKKTADSLIQNAAFMIVTLEDLQNSINKNGVISEYQNGENQWGTKKSPEVEIYNVMIKNKMLALRQLSDLLPKESAKVEDDGFDEFVVER